MLAYISDWLFQCFGQSKYHTLVHRTKWPITLFLFAITAFGSVPRICYSDHQLCNQASWIGTLQTTLRATIIVATITLLVEFVLQVILINNISQFLDPRRKRILWEIAILLNLRGMRGNEEKNKGNQEGSKPMCSMLCCKTDIEEQVSKSCASLKFPTWLKSLFYRGHSWETQFQEFLQKIFEGSYEEHHEKSLDKEEYTEISNEEDYEEISKAAWEKLIDDVPSEDCSPLQAKIVKELSRSVWDKLNSGIEGTDDKLSSKNGEHKVPYKHWIGCVINSAMELSEKSPATKIPRSRRVFERELEHIIGANDKENLSYHTLHKFINDLIYRFLDCSRGIIDARRVVRTLSYIFTGLLLIGAVVIYGRLPQ